MFQLVSSRQKLGRGKPLIMRTRQQVL